MKPAKRPRRFSPQAQAAARELERRFRRAVAAGRMNSRADLRKLLEALP